MGLSVALVGVEGDRMGDLASLYRIFGYGETEHRWELSDSAEFRRLLSDQQGELTTFRRGACSIPGWTVIVDPDHVMHWKRDACLNLSQALNARVFSMVISETTGSYAYELYQGKCVGGFFVEDGELVERHGKIPQAAVKPPAGRTRDQGIFDEMERLGVRYPDVWSSTRNVVTEFAMPRSTQTGEQKWDEILSDGRKQQVRELEAVALNERYPDALRLRARDTLALIADDKHHADWLRQLAKEAVERIDRSNHPPLPPV